MAEGYRDAIAFAESGQTPDHTVRARIVEELQARYDREEPAVGDLIVELGGTREGVRDASDPADRVIAASSLREMAAADLALRARADRDSMSVKAGRERLEQRAGSLIMRAMARMGQTTAGERDLERIGSELALKNGHPEELADVADLGRHEEFLAVCDELERADRELLAAGSGRMLVQQWVGRIRQAVTLEQLFRTRDDLQAESRVTDEERALLMTALNDQSAAAQLSQRHATMDVQIVEDALNATQLAVTLLMKDGQFPSAERIEELYGMLVRGFSTGAGVSVLSQSFPEMAQQLQQIEAEATRMIAAREEAFRAKAKEALEGDELGPDAKAALERELKKLESGDGQDMSKRSRIPKMGAGPESLADIIRQVQYGERLATATLKAQARRTAMATPTSTPATPASGGRTP